MIRPDDLWDQLAGKAFAEAGRGCGVWPLQPHPVDLEPPWEAFDQNSVTPWDCYINDWEAAWEGNAIKRMLNGDSDQVLARDESLSLPAAPPSGAGDLAAVKVEQFCEDEFTIPKADQFLRSLPYLRHPVSFELFGIGQQPDWDQDKLLQICKERSKGSTRSYDDAIVGWKPPFTAAQFVAHRADIRRVERQLLTHYANSAIVASAEATPSDYQVMLSDIEAETGLASTLSLTAAYCKPLRCFDRLDPDPIGVAISAMDHLRDAEWAMVQILFQPTRYPWPRTLDAALTDSYTSQMLLSDISPGMLNDKFSSPLFAVSIRLLSSREDVFRQLQGWAKQFALSPQTFDFQLDEDEASRLSQAVQNRCAFRPGILLNTRELSSLVHLPSQSVVSERLRRVVTRTRPAAETQAERGTVVLGENVHRGKRRIARIPASLRPRHAYVAGASGTGKSTLLLHMILQDIDAGEGVGVLDPHGDLVTDVLQRIPAHRVDDVILFDPSDSEYPFALNILDAADKSERERIVSETIMALQRYFPSSWGSQLERILNFTLLTVLDAIPGATLADVEQMMIDPDFRESIIQRTTNPRYVAFWDNEFITLRKNAVDPVLNRISVFLLRDTVRNIICQRHSAVDFDDLLNNGKILLANLSTGLLTEQIAGTLGSFLTTKIVNAAFRRARVPEPQRCPFYLYVDEFQSFMNLSVGFDRILAEARKYKLVLAGLANQYVGQLSPEVRAAIFGNVGTLATFRLGVGDANLLEREMGIFTSTEILNLELGQAIVRVGGSATAFNLTTYPPPPCQSDDPTPSIVANTRKCFARPREEVEREFHTHHATPAAAAAPPPPQRQQPSPKPSERKQRPSKGHRPQSQPKKKRRPPPPTDPSEDDFVS